MPWLETFIARLWNRRRGSRETMAAHRVLDLGALVVDGEPTRRRIGIEHARRAESVAILGKTGTGKSSLIRYMAQQDIRAGRGFAFFDLHGDATRFLLSCIAERERARGEDLSGRVILIDPADPRASVGLNPIEGGTGDDRFVEIAEFAQILRQRWQLDSFGARTDELLRNTLYVLAANGFTLVELGLLLTDTAFRSACLARVDNADVKQYFEERFNHASDAMRAVLAEPILNKTSAFVADPRFRHVVGQERSTFSVLDAMDRGHWIILNLDKGRLGPQAATLGSLFLARIKHALFARRRRDLFTLYCDEIQNLVAFGGGLETVLAEARKFGTGIVSANQFLDQYPADMRAAILAVGTHVFFQLSSSDAHQMAAALDGGKPLGELLKNLPRRHMVVKTTHERWREGVVPRILEPKTDGADLQTRAEARYGRIRQDIENDIRERQRAAGRRNREVLNDWE